MRIGFDKQNKLNAPRHPVMATIATVSFNATVKAYQTALEYELIETAILSEALARHWGLAGLAGARVALMRPKSGVPVFFRFIEVSNSTPVGPKCGWFALEICVSDVEALYETLIEGGAFTPFAEPTPLAFTDRVYPMQCKGPAGEILYLNQVRGSLPEINLPIASSKVDHLFIAILSSPDMEASNEYYCDLLDMTVNERHEIAYKTINRVHGLPLKTHHKLCTLGGHRHVGLEIDQYPGLANPPSVATAETVSEGILMVSFTTSKLSDELDETSVNLPIKFYVAPYNGARSVVLIGSAAERIELIELTH